MNDSAARFCYSCGLPLDETRRSELASSVVAQEAVLGGQPAGFWIRFVALIIDGVILSIVYFVIWPLLFDYGYFDWQTSEDYFSIATLVTYYSLTTSLWGTTVGKRVFNLWVVGADGKRISIMRAIGRYFSTWISAVTLFIGYIMIGVRKDKRALHDLIAGTWVIRK